VKRGCEGGSAFYFIQKMRQRGNVFGSVSDLQFNLIDRQWF